MTTKHSPTAKSAIDVLKGPLSPIPSWFPARVNTRTAELLAVLLRGEDVSELDPRFAQPAAPAAAIVRHLEDRHRWRIQRRKFAYSTTDGRVLFATKYALSADVLKKARACGSKDWIQRVLDAAADRLANAERAKAKAAMINRHFARYAHGATQ